jgi:hypothetical protein
MTPEEQSEAFKREVQRMIDAGELNSTEADAVFERAIAGVRVSKDDPSPNDYAMEVPGVEPGARWIGSREPDQPTPRGGPT